MGAAFIAVATKRNDQFSYEAVAVAWFKHPEIITKGQPLDKLRRQLLAVVHIKNTNARNAVRAAANRAAERLVHRELLKPDNTHSIEILLEHSVHIKDLPFDHREAKDHYLVKLARRFLKEASKNASEQPSR